MRYKNILVTSEDNITSITLNHPDKRNALSLEVILELTDAFQKTAQSDARGMILMATGQAVYG